MPGCRTDATACASEVRGVNFVAFPQKVNEISTGTASAVQDSHSGCDAALQKLIEEIDIDLTELLLEGRHGNFINLAEERGGLTDVIKHETSHREHIGGFSFKRRFAALRPLLGT